MSVIFRLGWWWGDRGAGGVRETGEERAGSGILKKAKFSKSKLSLFVDAYHPVKETTPTTFFDFHLTFSEV